MKNRLKYAALTAVAMFIGAFITTWKYEAHLESLELDRKTELQTERSNFYLSGWRDALKDKLSVENAYMAFLKYDTRPVED